MSAENPRGLTPAAAAARAGVSRSAIYRLIDRRLIDYSRPPGSDIRIPIEAADALREGYLFRAKRRGRGEVGTAPSSAAGAGGLAARALREVIAEEGRTP